MLQAKIERGTHGVNSCLEAGQACQHYYNALEDDSNLSPKACNECLDALTMHREDMVRQLENFRRLQYRSENVLALVSCSACSNVVCILTPMLRFPKSWYFGMKSFSNIQTLRLEIHSVLSLPLPTKAGTIKSR